MIWKKNWTLEQLNSFHDNTMQRFLGIEFLEIGEATLTARMPVNERTKQPHGLLHGGANVVLAESLGSVASVMCVDETKTVVGLEINANHLKAVRDGFVTGVATPIHIGRSTQVWEIKIYNEKKELTCISRITNAVLDKK